MNTRIKKTLCLLLTLVLTVSAASPAFAAVRILSGDEKAQMVAFFNESVNAIKSQTPKATAKYKSYVPDKGLTTAEGEEVDDQMSKYLIPVLEGLFNNRSSITRGFLSSLMGENVITVDQLELHRGMLRNNSVPVYGKDYVSILTPADDFELMT